MAYIGELRVKVVAAESLTISVSLPASLIMYVGMSKIYSSLGLPTNATILNVNNGSGSGRLRQGCLGRGSTCPLSRLELIVIIIILVPHLDADAAVVYAYHVKYFTYFFNNLFSTVSRHNFVA